MRYRLAIVGLLVLAPIAAQVGWWLMPEPRVSRANYERIREGMTLGEVEVILGDPVPEDEFEVIRGWEESGALIVVTFAEDGRVSSAVFHQYTLWERLEDWYHGVKRWPDRSKRLEAAA